jgi:radical SAM protein with 4Fe4S-binding SPASM domain
MTTTERLDRIDHFVASTREALFVRRADQLLMIRPDKSMGINHTAAEILSSLYNREGRRAGAVLGELGPRLGVDAARLLDDTEGLIQAVGAILNEDFSPRPMLRFGTFDRKRIELPVLAEIALTYGCQARCVFCYASSPQRGDSRPPMTTDQVKLVMDRIFREAHVPSLSFTGGEATLRKDLPELIRYGRELGFRVNLITNGIRAGDAGYARDLVEAGLASAQVSLEAATAELHDAIVGKAGAFDRTVAGVRNFKRLGIHVHTNTTLCAANLDHAEDLVRFLARELGNRTFSMNMVIRTGQALAPRGSALSGIGVSYTQVAARLPAIIETARREDIRFVWYSPIPYCIFNPVLHGLGAKSCACVDGILSVDPTGDVLPCSSFESGIGSLLEQPFDRLFRGRAARYWRDKAFVPPVCADCPDVDVCAGACPLYWDAAGGFGEIPRAGSGDGQARAEWEETRARSRSFGVRPRRSRRDQQPDELPDKRSFREEPSWEA